MFVFNSAPPNSPPTHPARKSKAILSALRSHRRGPALCALLAAHCRYSPRLLFLPAALGPAPGRAPEGRAAGQLPPAVCRHWLRQEGGTGMGRKEAGTALSPSASTPPQPPIGCLQIIPIFLKLNQTKKKTPTEQRQVDLNIPSPESLP